MDTTLSADHSFVGNGSILIVGDWFIDEHWVVGIHRSPTSSRTGHSHRRALQPHGDEIRAFCGAGRSAFMLSHFLDGKKTRLFDMIIGLGFWHEADTLALQHMFDPASHQHSPARITPVGAEADPPSHVRLLNLHEFLSKTNADRQFTARIIRIYERDKYGNVSYDRIDWEPQLRHVKWKQDQLSELEERVDEIACGSPIRAVMVKDLRKNAVSDALIKRLVTKFGSASTANPRWYVSSKKWEPSWLDSLREVNLELFMIPEVAAREAYERVPDLSRWLTKEGYPTEECLAVLERIHEKLANRGMILVSPGGYQLVARSPEGNNAFSCIVQSERDARKAPVPMGGASIFFPALAACIEYSRRSGILLKAADLIQHSLVCTADWVKAESNRVMNPPARWEPDPRKWGADMPRLLDIETVSTKSESFGKMSSRTWESMKNEWAAANNPANYGVVKIDSKPRIQLWRAMVEVPGYVALHAGKRLKVKNLYKDLERFAECAVHHEAAMLKASPGTGKTYLVRQLASACGLRFVPFNVTHVTTAGEIVKWFDQIGSLQSANEREKHLIFVDEINADLQRGKVYGSFLSVLEDGIYVRDGQTTRLRPCVWIFAGTEDPANTVDVNQKGQDFRSRLNLGITDLNDSHVHGITELERIYVGVATLRSEFPDATMISPAALSAFAHFEPQSLRDLKYFVRGFTKIQYGKVLAPNVPTNWPGVPDDQRKTWMNHKPKEDPYDDQVLIEL